METEIRVVTIDSAEDGHFWTEQEVVRASHLDNGQIRLSARYQWVGIESYAPRMTVPTGWEICESGFTISPNGEHYEYYEIHKI